MRSCRCLALSLLTACAGSPGTGGVDGAAPGASWSSVRSLWSPACELGGILAGRHTALAPPGAEVDRRAVLGALAALACSQPAPGPPLPALPEIARVRLLAMHDAAPTLELRDRDRVERVLAFLAARSQGWRRVAHRHPPPQSTLILYGARGEVLAVFWLGAGWLGATLPDGRGMRSLAPGELQELRILLEPVD